MLKPSSPGALFNFLSLIAMISTASAKSKIKAEAGHPCRIPRENPKRGRNPPIIKNTSLYICIHCANPSYK